MIIAMLAIHRSSFASALLDNAANPLNTQFAPSVLAAHRCASLLIQSLTAQFEQCPEISARIAQPWSAGFSSVMVAGSIVLQTPTSAMASGSLTDLTAGVELFQKAAALRCRPASVALVSPVCYGVFFAALTSLAGLFAPIERKVTTCVYQGPEQRRPHNVSGLAIQYKPR